MRCLVHFDHSDRFAVCPGANLDQGKYPFPVKDGVIPGSDAAGIVEAVGPRVTRFKPGGKHIVASCALDMLTIGQIKL